MPPEEPSVHAFASLDELMAFLRDWQVWQAPQAHEYDVNSMIRLLGACADNLRRHALTAELADIPLVLEPEQVAFLRDLGRLLERGEEA